MKDYFGPLDQFKPAGDRENLMEPIPIAMLVGMGTQLGLGKKIWLSSILRVGQCDPSLE